MTISARVHQLLERATAILPASDEDLIYKGIVAGVSERIVDIKKATVRLQAKYGSIEGLKHRLQSEGVSPDDHTLYTDLLEWQAIHHKLAELLQVLEAM